VEERKVEGSNVVFHQSWQTLFSNRNVTLCFFSLTLKNISQWEWLHILTGQCGSLQL
jgi:hypothetical protein